jgi:hypothetical protein
MNARLAIAFTLAAFSFALPAAAQDKVDPAAADALFKRGVDLLKKDDWAGGCAAFEASMKLEPSVGTQINLARCADHDGKIAQAWAAFRKAKALNLETPLAKRKANVDQFVDAEIARLEPRLPWITVRVRLAGKPDEAVTPEALRGVAIDRDGTVFPTESLTIAVPIDPGTHTFRVSASGYKPTTSTIEIKEGQQVEVVLELVDEPKPPPGQGPVAPPPKQPKTDAPEEGTSPLVYAGIGVASVGAASLIVAAVTGGLANSESDTITELEDRGACTRQSGAINCNSAADQAAANDAVSSGESMALASTVTLFAGIGLGVTGVVLIAVGATSSPSPTDDVAFAPAIGPGFAGLNVGWRLP